MKRIETDEELRHLRNNGTGLIYNDFSGTGAGGDQYNVLHHTTCYQLNRANLGVPKLHFKSLAEAQTWLGANRGAEGVGWTRCGTCKAERQ